MVLNRLRLRTLLVFLPAVLVSCAGCTSVRPYRLQDDPCTYNDLNPKLSECESSIVEKHSSYDLAFIEFDDQGWFFNRQTQLFALLKLLDEPAPRDRTHGLSIVVFVHGWKHSAKADDENIHAFRELLTYMTASRPTERIVGVYVGWRGLSADVEPLKEASFFDRKFTADHVAKGSVRELFARLVQFKKSNGVQASPTDKAIHILAIGHSFGGLVLFNAVSENLLASAVRPGIVEPDIDLTVLVNPAFEASRYEPLFEITECRTFEPTQKPVFITLTAENDSATHWFFRLGRKLSTFLERYPNNIDAEQELANHNTLGWIDRYRTHDLFLIQGKSSLQHAKAGILCEPLNKPVCGKSESRIKSTSHDIEDQPINGSMVLRQDSPSGCDAHNPFWIVRTDSGIINGHSDFYSKPYFLDFVLSEFNNNADVGVSTGSASAAH